MKDNILKIDNQIQKDFNKIFFILPPKTGTTYLKTLFRDIYHWFDWKDNNNLNNLIHIGKHSSFLELGSRKNHFWDGCPMEKGIWCPEKHLYGKFKRRQRCEHKKIDFRDEKTINIATCRNPFDLLVSVYHFDYLGRISIPHDINEKEPKQSFEDFIKKFCDLDYKPFFNAFYRNVLNWQAFDANGDNLIDCWIRSEYIDDGIELFFTYLKLDEFSIGKNSNFYHVSKRNTDLEWYFEFFKKEYLSKNYKDNKNLRISPKLGKGSVVRKNVDYRSYYTDYSRELVENHFSNELEIFNYNFDGPLDKTSLFSFEKLFMNWDFLKISLEEKDKKIFAENFYSRLKKHKSNYGIID